MEKTFTGDYALFNEIRNFLINEGFKVQSVNSIHVGNNIYEFEEEYSDFGIGCHNIHKILAWKDEEIKYKKKVISFICND